MVEMAAGEGALKCPVRERRSAGTGDSVGESPASQRARGERPVGAGGQYRLDALIWPRQIGHDAHERGPRSPRRQLGRIGRNVRERTASAAIAQRLGQIVPAGRRWRGQARRSHARRRDVRSDVRRRDPRERRWEMGSWETRSCGRGKTRCGRSGEMPNCRSCESRGSEARS